MCIYQATRIAHSERVPLQQFVHMDQVLTFPKTKQARRWRQHVTLCWATSIPGASKRSGSDRAWPRGRSACSYKYKHRNAVVSYCEYLTSAILWPIMFLRNTLLPERPLLCGRLPNIRRAASATFLFMARVSRVETAACRACDWWGSALLLCR